MSLILDALRRADSERERGSVPGLYAQPALPASIEAGQPLRARPWHWIVMGALVGLSASLAWYIVGRDATRQAPASALETPAAPVASAAPTARAAAPRPIAEPAPWPPPETEKAPVTTLAAVAGAGRPAANAEQPFDSRPAESPVYARDQLPEKIRAELPQLAIGGSMYSTNPANRSLIINGRLYRESDRLTDDLSLEQIKLKAAVLKYKAYRFEIQF